MAEKTKPEGKTALVYNSKDYYPRVELAIKNWTIAEDSYGTDYVARRYDLMGTEGPLKEREQVNSPAMAMSVSILGPKRRDGEVMVHVTETYDRLAKGNPIRGHLFHIRGPDAIALERAHREMQPKMFFGEVSSFMAEEIANMLKQDGARADDFQMLSAMAIDLLYMGREVRTRIFNNKASSFKEVSREE